MMKKIVFFFMFFFISVALLSQNLAEDIQLAEQYYKSKEFDKAEVVYQKLYDQTAAKYYFNLIIDCLIEQKKFDEAEKNIKKQIKKNKNDLSFIVDLGYLYKQQGEEEKGEIQYKTAVENLTFSQEQTINLANAFIARRAYDYAAQVYINAQNATGKLYLRELAVIYSFQRKYPEMIEQYLALISVNTTNFEEVSTRLLYFIPTDVNDEFWVLLRTAIIKKIQQEPNKNAFSELLIRAYVQKNELNAALIQAKALDRKQNESGKRILNIAQIAMQNKQLDIAADAFKYVENKGNTFPFYFQSKFGLLNVLYTKVANQEITTREQIENLEKEYQQTISEIGNDNFSIQTMIDLAHLQAFYLNKPAEALKTLNQAVQSFGLTKQAIGECQIEIGDIMLFQGDIWQASLLYAQAEKANKDNETGDKALLRKAKLAFYAHDFRWAKAQLDALKAASSKLVANDALALSTLIEEASTEDSITKPLELFASAEMATFRKNNDSALFFLDSLITLFKDNPLVDDALLKKADIFQIQEKYTEALDCLKKITDTYSYDILADEALFRTAEIYDNNLNDKDKASDFYRKIITDHPDSIFASPARKRFRELRDGNNEKYLENRFDKPIN